MGDKEMKAWVQKNCKFAQGQGMLPFEDPAPVPQQPQAPVQPPQPQPQPQAQPQQGMDPEEQAAHQLLANLGVPFDPAKAVRGSDEIEMDSFPASEVPALATDPWWAGGGEFPVTLYVEFTHEPYHPADFNGPAEGGSSGTVYHVVTQYGKDIADEVDSGYLQQLGDKLAERDADSRRDDYDDSRNDPYDMMEY